MMIVCRINNCSVGVVAALQQHDADNPNPPKVYSLDQRSSTDPIDDDDDDDCAATNPNWICLVTTVIIIE